MLGYTVLLIVGATVVSASPPYVQSRVAFAQAKTFVAEALDPQVGDIHDKGARKHHAYGILAGVTGGLVAANKSSPEYDPMLEMSLHFPCTWRNYNEIALKTQEFLNKASVKISPISDLIDNLCDADSVDNCNNLVQNKVNNNPFAYKASAELLLQLGNVAETIRDLESTLESVTNDRTELPYLINNVNSPKYTQLVADLERTNAMLVTVMFRRFNPSMIV